MVFNSGSGGDTDQGVIDLLARFRVEKRANAEALSELARLRGEFNQFADEVALTDRILGKQVLQLQKEKIEAAKASQEVQAFAQAEQKVRTEVERTTKALERRNATQREGNLREAVSAGGDVSTNLGALSALGRIGGTDIGVLQDLSDLVEQLPLLKQSLLNLPQAAGAAITAIGPIGIAVAALGAGLLALKSSFDATLKSMQDEIQVRQRLNELRVEGTQDEIRAEIQRSALDLQKERLNLLQAETEVQQDLNSIFEDGLDLGEQLRLTLGFFNLAEAELRANSDEAKRAQGEIDRLTSFMEGLENILNDSSVVTNTAREEEEELVKLRKDSVGVLDQLAQQEEDLANAFRRQQREREEDDSLRLQFRDEDRLLEDERRATQHQETLAQIEDAGNDRIEALREGHAERLVDLETKLGENLAKITTDVEKAVAEENEKFRDAELKRARDFRREEDKQAEQFQKQRLRREQDNALELFDAELANDTARFIQAKQRQRLEAARAQEDFDDSRSQRRADFLEERRERQQAKTERIADLREEAAERTRAAQAEFAKEKAALEQKTAEAIALEKAAIDERTNDAIDAFSRQTDELIASRERADERQRTLDGIQAGRRQAAHNEALAQIEARRQAENRLLSDIATRINAIRSQLGLVSSLGLGGSSFSNVNRPARSGFQAFGLGGIATGPTLGMLAERPGYHEAAIPFRPSEGIERAIQRLGLGSPNVTFQHFGDIRTDENMTRSEFKAEMTGILTEIIEANAAVRYGRLPAAVS